MASMNFAMYLKFFEKEVELPTYSDCKSRIILFPLQGFIIIRYHV